MWRRVARVLVLSHFRVRSPCVHRAGMIYDRVVEVAYTQAGIAHIQEIPMLPLTVTHHRAC